MKHSLHKTLAFASGLLLLISVGVELADGQGRNSKGAPKRPKPQQTAQAPAKWYTFTSPDNDFTVQFPAQPKREEADTQQAGDVAVWRRYSYYGNPLWLSVRFQDLGFPPNSKQANDLGPNIEERLAEYTIE